MAITLLRQLYSRAAWLADGGTTLWNFSFTGGYLDKTHVKARIRNIVTDQSEEWAINYATDFVGPFQLRVIPAVPAGHEFTIYRDTPKDLPIHDFQDGARISERSLDDNAKQAVFISSETLDALLDELFKSTLIDNGFGFKSLRKIPYTGASSVIDLDNGRAHYKTDGTSVTVPATLREEFLTTIVNDSMGVMSVTFAEGAILQGSADPLGYSNWTLSPRSLLSITKVAPGRWFISGNVSRA
jgi:hypothetical protein